MSDVHFSLTTGEVLGIIMGLAAALCLVVFVHTVLIHWIGHVRWLYATLLGVLATACTLGGIYLYVNR
jgi:hypothetical protein